jgi:2-furoyl-CoA dehydrogenase large subunit
MDTALTPWTLTTGSYSSRFSPLLISALCRACEKIKRTISAAAAVILQDDSSNLEFINGMVRVKTAPERAVSFRDAAGLVHWDPARLPEDVEPTLYVEAAFSPPEAGHATSNDQINSSLCYGFVVEVVAVEINPETLETEIKLLVSVHDEGTILNPGIVDGQILGGVVHGLGGALYEELVYDDSCQPRSVTFMDYLCPTAGDCAFPTVIQHLGHPSPFTTLGSKGCGEGSAMAMPVAVANAVADALSPLGVSVRALPLHGSALDSLLSGGSSVLEEWR